MRVVQLDVTTTKDILCDSIVVLWLKIVHIGSQALKAHSRIACGLKRRSLPTFAIDSWMLCNDTLPPSPPVDNIWIMVIIWRLRGNIIRTALCWIVWHNVHSQQHTYMSSSCRSNRLGLSPFDPYAVHRGGCLELYYCNMVELFWWDSSLISTTNWFPSVLWHCWPEKSSPKWLIMCRVGR